MWIALRVHSQYSILDSTATVNQLAKYAADFGMSSLALTDHGNLFGAIEFVKACQQVGIKPIIGCDFYVAPKSRLDKTKEYGERNTYALTLLAKNNQGYHNLCKLSTIGYLEGFYYYPRIDHDALAQHSEGIICLSGGLNGRVGYELTQGSREKALELITRYHNLFGDDYYFELQRHPMADQDIQKDGMHQETWLLQQYQDYVSKQKLMNDALIAIGKERGIKCVATNDSHYMERDDWKAHEILLNVQSGEPCEVWEKDSMGNLKFRTPNPKRRTYPSHEFYFKNPQQMATLFEDIPQSIETTLEVADKCNLKLDFNTKHYPVFIPPDLKGISFTPDERQKAVENFLWQLCHKGVAERYTQERLEKVKDVYPGRDPLDVVNERLNLEMGIIAPKGMCDYLLIVWDFINWAKKRGIPVGPGRGSGAGSIVLYLIGVTDIEPLRFHLFFERFINPERFSYPDIDVDICMDRRSEVIHYTLEKYGAENVAQIITFGTMKAKSSIKDVGRVLSVPLSKVNAIAKLVPDDLGITLEKAVEIEPELRAMVEQDEETKRILVYGKKLEGSVRNTGIHAAGLIISGDPLREHIPLAVSKDSDIPVTQYSMKPVEQVGMLKIDFLGLKTLTAIQMTVDALKKTEGKSINWVDLPLDDKATFDLLNKGKTLGVFQLESSGMQDLARQLHLDRFEEIIAVGALYRPGPMEMIPSFINRKHGREAIEYDHPWMREILAETYGIMVYQEQVMQIASKLANFSLGEGDVLRKAMGKKDHEQMTKQREKFLKGALENGIDQLTAMHIFDKMEKFASYGFNKSHAAAYGYLSYVTAYLKANYPREWMAALMTCDSADVMKVAKFIRECKTMNIPLLPPDINEAGVTFTATPEGIRFAMSAIKGVGMGSVEAIVSEREKRGTYQGLFDFFKRIDNRKVGKKVVENLVDAGAFDSTGWSRDALRKSIDPMHDIANREKKEEAAGVMTFFSMFEQGSECQFSKPPEVKNPRSKQENFQKEKELLGFFLTGHPLEHYRHILSRLACVPFTKIPSMESDTIFRTAFIVESVAVRLSSKTQKKFAILTISDGIDNYELPIWSDMYEEKAHLLVENRLLYAVLQVVRESDDNLKLSCHWIDDLTQADEPMIKSCDEAFDRAKHKSRRPFQGKNKGKIFENKPSEKREEKDKKNKTLIFKINVEQMRLSHILKLKNVFQDHQGDTPVKIDFHDQRRKVGTLHLDVRCGVMVNASLEKELLKIPGITLTAKSDSA